jgi:hypothetical protein
VLRAFLFGAWQACLPKHPSKKPVTAKPCGALGKTSLLRCVSAANTIQSWSRIKNFCTKCETYLGSRSEAVFFNYCTCIVSAVCGVG